MPTNVGDIVRTIVSEGYEIKYFIFILKSNLQTNIALSSIGDVEI